VRTKCRTGQHLGGISRTHDDKLKCDICDTETCYETIISKAHSLLDKKIMENIIDEDNKCN